MTTQNRRWWQSWSTTAGCVGACASTMWTRARKFGCALGALRSSRTSLWLVLALLAGSSVWCQAGSLTLSWDAPDTTNVLGYRIYQSVGTAAFIVTTNAPPTARSIAVLNVDT